MKRLLLPIALLLLALPACSSRSVSPSDSALYTTESTTSAEEADEQEQEAPQEALLARAGDQDNDGVADSVDQCPDTPANLGVDVTGCPPPNENPAILYYPTGGNTPDADSRALLLHIGQVMLANPVYGVLIEGHTDSVGDSAANMALSERRAAEVAQYLVQEMGLDAARLRLRGLGESSPLASNDTAQGRAQNRRVTLTIVEALVEEPPPSPPPPAGEGQESSGTIAASETPRSPAPADPTAGAAPVVQGSRRDMERQGLSALAQNDFATAYAVFAELLKDYPEDENINFNMGLAAYGMENYPLALFYFERLLMWNPDADRVRLEMAMTYMAMNQPEEAKREFETVLSHDPPEQVRENILAYMELMESQEPGPNVSGTLQLGWFYDSNVNYGASSELVETDIGDIILDDEALPSEDQGMLASASVHASLPLDEDGEILALIGGNHYRTEHDTENHTDMATTGGSTGLRFIMGNHILQVQGKVQDIDYGGHDLINLRGGSITYLYAVTPRTHLIADSHLEWRDNLPNDDRDAWFTSLGGYVRFMIGDSGSNLVLGARYFKDDAKEAVHSSAGYDLSATYTMKLPEEITISIGLGYKDIRYDAPASTLVQTDRRDHERRLTASIKKGIWEGFSVMLSTQVSSHTSSFDAYSYNKFMHSVSLIYEF
ncbi:MAG: DUF560 domain-containing protein [Desulfovibrio sp.]|nr:MAG: DUF560 domain-containing protein [Desulfovibrio sp.]